MNPDHPASTQRVKNESNPLSSQIVEENFEEGRIPFFCVRDQLAEIGEMLVQLFEDKAKRKQVLDLAARERSRQAFLAQRLDLPFKSRKRRLRLSERRRRPAGRERGRTGPQVFARARAKARQRRP
jgi:hypothetical protein